MDNVSNTPMESRSSVRRSSRLRRVRNGLILSLRTLTSAAVYATLIVTFGFQVARVEGRSMEPTLHDQDRLVVNEFAYQVHDPDVGDVVMLLHPNNPSQSLVKRIVAAPGDSVAFREGSSCNPANPPSRSNH